MAHASCKHMREHIDGFPSFLGLASLYKDLQNSICPRSGCAQLIAPARTCAAAPLLLWNPGIFSLWIFGACEQTEILETFNPVVLQSKASTQTCAKCRRAKILLGFRSFLDRARNLGLHQPNFPKFPPRNFRAGCRTLWISIRKLKFWDGGRRGPPPSRERLGRPHAAPIER